ncbi:hypothetical protein P9112_003217 [Eukaryota sp. TZLM1-RC]
MSPRMRSLRMSLFQKPSADSLSNLSPLSWSDFFDSAEDITTSRGPFRLYSTTFSTQKAVVFSVHGASYSSLSFAPLAKRMKSDYCFLATDLRNHGETAVDGPLSLQDILDDLNSIISSVSSRFPNPTKLFLLGHSLGGSVISHLSRELSCSSFDLRGLVCIDVCENTAIESLPFLKNYLDNRPVEFRSLKSAIKWAKSSKSINGEEALRVHVPSLLKPTDKGTLVWRASSSMLLDNECYWKQWFEGSFRRFVEFSNGKLMVLANIDRLDRDATIQQMAGKFQVEVVRNVGHSVHEDAPDNVAQILQVFFERYSKDLPFVNK